MSVSTVLSLATYHHGNIEGITEIDLPGYPDSIRIRHRNVGKISIIIGRRDVLEFELTVGLPGYPAAELGSIITGSHDF